MLDPRDKAARDRICRNYVGSFSRAYNVHTVSFQPRGRHKNEDRKATDLWEINGQRWLFLAVFDGHLGSAAADYASKELPIAIRQKLTACIDSIGGRLNCDNVAGEQSRITGMLHHEILQFDKQLWEALYAICPSPWDLTEDQARALAQKHCDVLERICAGTTMALALVNLDEHFMWAAGVGDSSVGKYLPESWYIPCTANDMTIGLSVVGNDGKRQGHRLCEMHTFKDPQEYGRVIAAHPATEQPLFDWEYRVLGWMTIARAIGNYSLKAHSAYLGKLFGHLPCMNGYRVAPLAQKILTPPYISAEPSVRFTDLHPVWRQDTKLFLFTDGVDNLVDGWLVFKPREHSGADPVDIVSELMADHIDSRVEAILGHKVDPRWSGRENNRASDVLGNLLGGLDVKRLEMVTDLDLLNDESEENWPFHIDDTTIIVWSLTDQP
ncbi:protein serine/threonine phosphatase 2C [Trametes polyzona]|nr:protein serine/threonine phosphatase 2C [Trametes polyzona]